MRVRRPVLRVLGLVVAFVATAAAVVFLAWVATITLTPAPESADVAHTNTQPGHTIEQYMEQPSVRAALLQIGGNLVLLMPFGVLLPLISKSLRGPVRIAVCVGTLALMIESLQWAFIVGRAFDIDDSILNTAGALLAYVFIGRPLAQRAPPNHDTLRSN